MCLSRTSILRRLRLEGRQEVAWLSPGRGPRVHISLNGYSFSTQVASAMVPLDISLHYVIL